MSREEELRTEVAAPGRRPQTWDILAEVVAATELLRDPLPPRGKFPPRNRFELFREDEANYAVLFVFTWNPNYYQPGEMRGTRHEFVVPVATYRREAWIRWLFDRIASVEIHELCETFFVDGVRVYPPHHGQGWDPYTTWFPTLPGEAAKAPGEA